MAEDSSNKDGKEALTCLYETSEDATKDKKEERVSVEENKLRYQCRDTGNHEDGSQLLEGLVNGDTKRPSKTNGSEDCICQGNCISKITPKFDDTLSQRLKERRIDRNLALENAVKIKRRIHLEIKELVEILKERERELVMYLDEGLHEITDRMDDQICVLNYYASALGAASSIAPDQCKCIQELDKKIRMIFDDEEFNSAVKFEYSSKEFEVTKRSLSDFGKVKKTHVNHKDLAQYRQNNVVKAYVTNLLASSLGKESLYAPVPLQVPLNQDYLDDSDSSISSDDFEVVDHYDAANAMETSNKNVDSCTADNFETEVAQDVLKSYSFLNKGENDKDNSKDEGNLSEVKKMKPKVPSWGREVFSPKISPVETAQRVSNHKLSTAFCVKTPMPLKQQCALKCPVATIKADFPYPGKCLNSEGTCSFNSAASEVACGPSVFKKIEQNASSALISACETYFDKNYKKWLYNGAAANEEVSLRQPTDSSHSAAPNDKQMVAHVAIKKQNESGIYPLLEKGQASGKFDISSGNVLIVKGKHVDDNGKIPIVLCTSSGATVSETKDEIKTPQMPKTPPLFEENAELLSKIRPDKRVLQKIIKDLGKKSVSYCTDFTGEFEADRAPEIKSPRRNAAMLSTQSSDQPNKRDALLSEAIRQELNKTLPTDRKPYIDNPILEACYGVRKPYIDNPLLDAGYGARGPSYVNRCSLYGYNQSNLGGFHPAAMRFSSPNAESPHPAYLCYPYTNVTNVRPPALKSPRQYMGFTRPQFMQPCNATGLKGSYATLKPAYVIDQESNYPSFSDVRRYPTATPSASYSSRFGDRRPTLGFARQGMKSESSLMENFNLQPSYYDANGYMPPNSMRERSTTSMVDENIPKWKEDVIRVLNRSSEAVGRVKSLGPSEVKIAGKSSPVAAASNLDYPYELTGDDNLLLNEYENY